VTPEANRTTIPRPLLLLGVPLAGVFLVSLFIYLGFPYDRLGPILEAQAEAATEASLGVNAGHDLSLDNLPGFAHAAEPAVSISFAEVLAAAGDLTIPAAWSGVWNEFHV